MEKNKELELITDLSAVLFIRDTSDVWDDEKEKRMQELVECIENSIPDDEDIMQDPEVLELIFQKYGV